MPKFRLSIKRKINFAIVLLLLGFSAVGGVAVPVLRDLAGAVARADSLAQVLNAVTDAQVSILTLADESYKVDAGSVDGFKDTVGQVETRQAEVLAGVKGTIEDTTVAAAVAAIESAPARVRRSETAMGGQHGQGRVRRQ